jgi:hypothetical protein
MALLSEYGTVGPSSWNAGDAIGRLTPRPWERQGAAKWVNRQENCSTQPRATISINIPTGPCGGPAAEAAERRLGAHPHRKILAGEGGTRRASLGGSYVYYTLPQTKRGRPTYTRHAAK